jgi:hypothetical protein
MARVDSWEFTEWLAFDRLEPIGEGRLNLALANLAAMTANINRDREARPEPYGVEDFIPYHVSAPPPPLRQPSRAEVIDIEARMKTALGWRG